MTEHNYNKITEKVISNLVKKIYKTPENIRKANMSYYYSRKKLKYLCDCCKHISGCKSHMTDHIRSMKHIRNLKKYEGEIGNCIFKIKAC